MKIPGCDVMQSSKEIFKGICCLHLLSPQKTAFLEATFTPSLPLLLSLFPFVLWGSQSWSCLFIFPLHSILRLLPYPEDGGSRFLQNTGNTLNRLYQHYIPADSYHHSYHNENLKCHTTDSYSESALFRS
jgi:hypothetical protein